MHYGKKLLGSEFLQTSVMYVIDKAETPHWSHTTYSSTMNLSPKSLKSCQVRSTLFVFNPHQRICLFVLERERKKNTDIKV